MREQIGPQPTTCPNPAKPTIRSFENQRALIDSLLKENPLSSADQLAILQSQGEVKEMPGLEEIEAFAAVFYHTIWLPLM